METWLDEARGVPDLSTRPLPVNSLLSFPPPHGMLSGLCVPLRLGQNLGDVLCVLLALLGEIQSLGISLVRIYTLHSESPRQL